MVFLAGYLKSEPNKNLIYKNKPNNMGILLGTVSNYNSNKGYITLKLQDDISIGDTVSLENEKGTYTISELMINNVNTPSAESNKIVKIGRIKGNIHVNDRIYKMSSKELNNFANNIINTENIKTKINCNINIHKDTPISMSIYTSGDVPDLYSNINFNVTSDLVAVEAIKNPITKERIIEQINKLGGTPFEFNKISVDLDDNLYIPSISKLNQLRRDCIEKLEEILIERINRRCNIKLPDFNNQMFENLQSKTSVLLNNLNINFNYSELKNIDRLYIPLKYFYKPEYNSLLLNITDKFNTYIYMPSIMKDTIINSVEQSLKNILTTFNIKGFVISNISHIELLHNYKKNYELIANYNMNIFNDYTISELEKLELSCVTLSPELDKASINSFESSIPTEAIIYGNLPVMTTNYCLLSKSNFCLEKCNNNCCNSNLQYHLKDRLNMNFRIIPDSFSKTTTIYNSKITSISVLSINTDFVRFDFMDETIDEINDIISTFNSGKILEGKEYTNGNINRFV